jgi:hypothetical protein
MPQRTALRQRQIERERAAQGDRAVQRDNSCAIRFCITLAESMRARPAPDVAALPIFPGDVETGLVVAIIVVFVDIVKFCLPVVDVLGKAVGARGLRAWSLATYCLPLTRT